MAAPAPANPIGPALAFAASVAAIGVGLFIIIRFIFAAAPVSVGDDYEFTRLRFAAADYRSLDGWETDSVGEALEAFLLSCERWRDAPDDRPANRLENLGPVVAGVDSLAGALGDWRGVCESARRIVANGYASDLALSGAARAFFESEFTPIAVRQEFAPRPDGPARGRPPRLDPAGLATGYFEPIYAASKFRNGPHTAPVFMRPSDLVSVSLAQFDSSLAGKRIAGMVEDGRLTPYPDRADINRGALVGKAVPLAFMDPNELFFLQIQGSGRLRFTPEDEIRVGYDGQNGRPYYAIGRSLIDRGDATRENISMQLIFDWLRNAPADAAAALREENQSYVFFRELDDLPSPDRGPLGAQGVQLTAGRSVAVDRRFYPMGAPIWLQTPDVEAPAPGPPVRNGLYVAQDTGGAIRGPIRFDVFVGLGAEAGAIAGRMRADVEAYVLLPNAVAARVLAAERADPSLGG